MKFSINSESNMTATPPDSFYANSTIYAINIKTKQLNDSIEERYDVVLYIHAKSVLKAVFNQEKWEFQTWGPSFKSRAAQECEFSVISTAQGITPAGAYLASYASAEYLPPSVVGRFLGSALVIVNGESRFMSCTLDISSDGVFTLSVPLSPKGIYVTQTGDLDGRLGDFASKNIYMATLGIASSYRRGIDPDGVHLTTQNGLPLGAHLLKQPSTDPLPANCSFHPDFLPCYEDGCIPEQNSCGETPCESVGNPIHGKNGNKFQRETDYSGNGTVWLQFDRYYNSHWSVMPGSAGSRWRTTFDRSIRFSINGMTALANRADGKIIRFTKVGDQWQTRGKHAYTLTAANSVNVPNAAWALIDDAGVTEFYRNDGRLLLIRAHNGRFQKMIYSGEQLTRVEDTFGRALTFTYDDMMRLSTMRDPQNNLFVYTYSEAGLLKDVEGPGYPDRTLRQYIYDDPNHSEALTGIVDEKGIRYATWKYDDRGRAYESEHAGGVDRHTLVFNSFKTSVTDPLGTTRTHRFVSVLTGGIRLDGIDQPAGAGSPAASSSYSYDENGNLQSWTNFNGFKTSYIFDLTRNLETSRTEAVGTSFARTTTTEWHTKYRIPSRIAEPKRITNFAYYDNGYLNYKTIYQTSDSTGAQGFSAQLVGHSIRFIYTYHAGLPLLKSAFEPSFEGSPVVNETYTWHLGNLATVTNAVGHKTIFGDYTAHGSPQTVTHPNGLVSKYTYYPRGLVKSITQEASGQSRQTYFEYEPTGKLKRVSLPDGASVEYHYDDAQRLIGISDAAGNTITYELDNAGNRKSEQTKDSSGVLSRQITIVYDALNRLKTVTGGLQ